MAKFARLRSLDRRVWLLVAGILSVLLRYFAAAYPDLTEQWYGRGLFCVGRTVWDYTLGWSPVPLIYVTVGGLGLWIFWGFVRWFRAAASPIRPHHWLGNVLLNIGAAMGVFVGLFLVQWGYNYCRPPFTAQIGLQVDSLSLPMLRAEAQYMTQKCTESRRAIPHVTDGVMDTPYDQDFLDLEVAVRRELVIVLHELGFPTPGRVRGRLLYPAGILLRNNTAGVYLPWVAEGHIDAGLHPLQMPFTLAHELAHGYGFTDEGVCNFLAYLACERCTDPRIRYSGRLAYWRYVFAALRRQSTSAYLLERAKISPGMFHDLMAIKDNMAQYPDFLNGLQASAYDGYLKSQGVKAGMASYDAIVQMTVAWRKKNADTRPNE